MNPSATSDAPRLPSPSSSQPSHGPPLPAFTKDQLLIIHRALSNNYELEPIRNVLEGTTNSNNNRVGGGDSASEVENAVEVARPRRLVVDINCPVFVGNKTLLHYAMTFRIPPATTAAVTAVMANNNNVAAAVNSAGSAAATASANLIFTNNDVVSENDPQVVLVRYLVKGCGANLFTKASDGHTPFDAACFDGTAPLVRFLIRECIGVDVNTESKPQQLLPTFLAAHADTYTVLKVLVDEGASVSPLTDVQKRQREERQIEASTLLKALHRRDATDNDDENSNDKNNTTTVLGRLRNFLSSAIDESPTDAEAKKKTLKGVPPPDPLQGAFLSGCTRCLQLVLDGGCDVTAADIAKLIPVIDESTSPMLAANRRRHDAVAKLLLANYGGEL